MAEKAALALAFSLFFLLFPLLVYAQTVGVPELPPSKIYGGQTYQVTLNLTSPTPLQQDTDYSDGKVTYIYRIETVYSVPANKYLYQNQVQLQSVPANQPIYVTITYKAPSDSEIKSQGIEGKAIAAVALVKVDGTFDYSSGQWQWSYNIIDKTAQSFEIKTVQPPQPPPLDWLMQIFQAIINFFKKLFGWG